MHRPMEGCPHIGSIYTQSPYSSSFFRKLRYNSQTIKFNPFKCIIPWIWYTKMLSSYLLPLPSFRTFSLLQEGYPNPLAVSPDSYILHVATTSLLPISTDLPLLNTSCKRNHTRCSLSCLASFTSHNVFRVYYVSALCFFLWLNNILWRGYPTLCLFISWWAFGWFPHFGQHE